MPAAAVERSATGRVSNTRPRNAFWRREIAADHHRQVLAFLADLADRVALAEPMIVAQQVILLNSGATAAPMITNGPSALDIATRNLSAILAVAARVEG